MIFKRKTKEVVRPIKIVFTHLGGNVSVYEFPRGEYDSLYVEFPHTKEAKSATIYYDWPGHEC